MKKLISSMALAAVMFSANALGADSMHYFEIDKFMKSNAFKTSLSGNVEFKFGKGSGAGEKIIAKDLISNKKSSKTDKGDTFSDMKGEFADNEKACAWTLLSALKTFEERAMKEGGKKVVNLTGYFKKQEYDSKDRFQCAVGGIMVGVALRGDIAK